MYMPGKIKLPKECSRILLPTKLRLQFLKKLSRKNLSTSQREKLFKSVVEECKKVRKCEYCEATTKVIKKKPDNPLTLITYVDK